MCLFQMNIVPEGIRVNGPPGIIGVDVDPRSVRFAPQGDKRLERIRMQTARSPNAPQSRVKGQPLNVPRSEGRKGHCSGRPESCPSTSLNRRLNSNRRLDSGKLHADIRTKILSTFSAPSRLPFDHSTIRRTLAPTAHLWYNNVVRLRL